MSAAVSPAPPATANDFALPPNHGESDLHEPGRASTSSYQSQARATSPIPRTSRRLGGLGRHTLGIILLLITVFLWTASSFLASTMFADNSYSKPYFVTYINTAFFALGFIPIALKRLYENYRAGVKGGIKSLYRGRRWHQKGVDGDEDRSLYQKPDDDQAETRQTRSPASQLLLDDPLSSSQTLVPDSNPQEGVLDDWETAKLSLEFCVLWFAANYFAVACLQYTTVASTTILNSTSSIWTLLIGALVKVEAFNLKKLIGVLASMTGIVLISSVDLSGSNDKNRGSFPHKSQKQIAIGDSLAFVSAVLYGMYTILMKKRIGDEGRVNMPLFFGLVGVFNLVILWPGLIILHFTGEEPFELPPSGRIWTIIVINSATSLFSDFCWAYAMLLTSPLVVTVGLSLTIPLSLVGQMILDHQYSSFAYWIGAGIVFLSFIFINQESKGEEEASTHRREEVVYERVEEGGEH
ncbi:MAG: hypothetical protein M1812_004141 [Candelaria pacifica]|nr:MAG: hypothetical protein M1812_004141 [Candelaria pacifica]